MNRWICGISWYDTEEVGTIIEGICKKKKKMTDYYYPSLLVQFGFCFFV